MAAAQRSPFVRRAQPLDSRRSRHACSEAAATRSHRRASSAIAAAEALPQASTVARSRQGDPQGSVRLVFAAGTGGEKVVGGVWHSALHRGWAAELWTGE